MTVHFFEPPVPQRIGGLDAAIAGLRGALTRAGVTVESTLPTTAGNRVVHFHGLWQPAHARLSRDCRARGIPYLVSPHGMLEPWAWRHKWWKKWPYFHLVEKRHLAGAGALLATGPLEAMRLKKFAPRQRIEWLPLGLTGAARPDYAAARQQLRWSPEEQVLLFLSRLHVKKGPDLLLRALASMKWPAITRLVIVGDGDPGYVAGLKRFASEHVEKLPRIDWAGAVWGEARWKYFQGADLFCLPSFSENFGLAVLEACQVGTPVLTTADTPWANELAARGGYIATPRVESVRAELARFFAAPKPALAQRNGQADWAFSRFHWDRLAARYLDLYQSVAEPARNAPTPEPS